MRSRWCLAAAIALLCILLGCSKQGSAPVQAPPMAQPGSSENKPLTPADLRQRALDSMGKQEYDKAIADWKSLVEAEPTADNWNDLSYAYLQAKRYKDAADAGRKALDLQQDHPFASYNTGMAYLEDGQPSQAVYYLGSSEGQQPDRYEPKVALARAYQGIGSYALAAYYADAAAGIKGDAPEVKAVQAALAQMINAPLPPDLIKASVAKLQDGSTTVYLYPEQTKGQFSLYVLFGDGKGQRLPLGKLRLSQRKDPIQKAQLPNGFTGYWVDANMETIAYVAQSDGWMLAAVKDQTVRQVLFRSGAAVRDQVDSGGPPAVKGDRIFASHMDGASGMVSQRSELQLSVDMRTAAFVSTTEQLEGNITAIAGNTITVVPRRDGTGRYKRDFIITDATPIVQGGQPVTKGALKVDGFVIVSFEAQNVIKVEVIK